MNNIYFHNEDIEFKIKDKRKIIKWIIQTIQQHKKALSIINFIFCSDQFLLQLNKQHLNHDYYTDVITFYYGETDNIEGDIYISTERVKDNATLHQTNFNDELHRTMIHGVLHLLGYNDKTHKEKNDMRKLEDHYLALRFSF